MPPPRPVRPGPFALALVAALAGLAAVYLFFVRTRTGQGLDEAALLASAATFGAWSRANLQFLDYLPAFSILLTAVAVGYAALARRRWVASLVALAAAGTANGAAYALKRYVLERPDFGYNAFGVNTMPSGHTALTASSAAVVFLVASPRRRPLAAFAGATYTAVTGIATLVNQWHLPSDVLAACLTVSAVMTPAAWLILRREPAGSTAVRDDGRRWAARSLKTAAGAAAVTAVALLLLAVVPASERRVGTVPQAFAAGAAAIVGATYLVAAGASWLVGARPRRSPDAVPSAREV